MPAGRKPAARRADLSASQPTSKFNQDQVRPRRALEAVSAPRMPRVAKTVTGALATAALVGGMSLATTTPAHADAVGANQPRLSYGDRTIKVKRLQRELSAYGKNVPSTGYFGPITRNRVNRLKARENFRTNGVAGFKVWHTLFTDGNKLEPIPRSSQRSSGGKAGYKQPQLRYGERGRKVVRLQRELSAYGKNVPDTGWYGPMTTSRVKKVQSRNGWKTTGVAGYRVWHELFTDGNKVRPVKDYRSSGTSRSGGTRSAFSSSGSGSSKALRALAYAENQIGDSYVFGADGPDAFDCSGLTLAAYRSVGIDLPRTSQAQINAGTRVSRSNLQKGDLVFFYSGISHVGIYAGNGRIVHAANSSSPVEYSKVSYMPFAGAVRPA
jgi:peptidoglycan DL-endopeptidase CwlO